MIKYKKFNEDGEALTRSSMDSSDWTDKELYEDLPRALKRLRDSQGVEALKSKTVRGVIWDDTVNKWFVRFAMNGRRNFIGRFNTYEEAVYNKVKAVKEMSNA